MIECYYRQDARDPMANRMSTNQGYGRASGMRELPCHRVFHQTHLGTAFFFTGLWAALPPYSICAKIPGFTIIFQHNLQNLAKFFAQGRFFNGDGGFHTMRKITAHPVGGSHIELFTAAIGEPENPGMFQKSSDDAADMDVLA